MAIFTFDASHSLGRVRAVDTRRVNIQVDKEEELRKARVGQLVALRLPGAIEEWLIGIIESVMKSPMSEESVDEAAPAEAQEISDLETLGGACSTQSD
jgi:hypothetical protein